MRALVWAALLLAGFAAPLRAQNAAGPPLRIGEYLDTAALRTALAALPPMEAEKRMSRVFLLVFDSVDKPLRAIPAVPRVMPKHYFDAVRPLVQAALRPVDPRRYEPERLILVETGNPARVVEIFPPRRWPRVTNSNELSAELGHASHELGKADSTLAGNMLTAVVEMDVNEEGVMTASCIRRSTGFAAVDEMVLRLVTRLRFAPMLLDGEPVPSAVSLPIHIEFARRKPAARRRP